MPCLVQYSRRVIPLFVNPSTRPRISSLLRIPPFSAESRRTDKMGSSDGYGGTTGIRPAVSLVRRHGDGRRSVESLDVQQESRPAVESGCGAKLFRARE